MKTVIRLTTHNYNKVDVEPKKVELLDKMFQGWKQEMTESLWDRTIFPKEYDDETKQKEYIQELLDKDWIDMMELYNQDTEGAKTERKAREDEAYRLACKHEFKLDEIEEDILEFGGIVKPEYIRHDGELLRTGNAVLDISEKRCIINVRRNKLI